MTLAASPYTDDDLYPDDDGNPMAESTLQYEWIVLVKENLECWFAPDPNVVVAGDLLWYPVPVAISPAPCQAPDVMVIFGRPKAPRRSYLQFREENVAPQVVWEILSHSNKRWQGCQEMAKKWLFYNTYGVEEYYICDPENHNLEAFWRQEGTLQLVDGAGWVSPRLRVRFDWQPGQPLRLVLPNGEPFRTTLELAQERDRLQQEQVVLAQERDCERARAEELAAKLRALGIEP